MQVLLATWEGGGNVLTVLEAARRLHARGHRVRVMADAVAEAEVARTGAEFRPWHAAPSRSDRNPASDIVRDWEVEDDLGAFLRLRDRIMCGPALGYATDTLEALDECPADLILTHDMLFGVMAASEAAAVPLAVLSSNLGMFPIPGRPPPGFGLLRADDDAERARHAELADEFRNLLDEGLAALNAAREALWLPPLVHVLDQFGVARRVLLATSPDFDFVPDALPPRVRYLGPLFTKPPWANKPVASPTGERGPAAPPLVLVAFSSTFQNQLDVIRNAALALAGLPVQGVVTLGPALAGSDVETPTNVRLLGSVSHDELMARAVVVITHAGHGTVMRALSHGVPMLCLPMGRDQHDNAARVAARGAGLVLDRWASADAIREAVVRLLGDAGFRAAAWRLRDSIATAAGCADLIAEVEALVRTSDCAILQQTV